MSKRGHIPIRMCIGCKQRRRKAELVRFVKGAERMMMADGARTGKGRGFYLCPDPKCLSMAQKRGQREDSGDQWESVFAPRMFSSE